jgi:preprotein translocase subunit SecE
MSKSEGAVSGGGFWTQTLAELLKTEIYKRNQGKIVRQATCIAIWVGFALGAYQLYHYMHAFLTNVPLAVTYSVPTVLLVLGIWFGYRLVNLPTFADFLIAVEAEMNKVSWPSQTELIRASLVVIVLMFGLTVVIFGYDVILSKLLQVLGVVQVSKE